MLNVKAPPAAAPFAYRAALLAFCSIAWACTAETAGSRGGFDLFQPDSSGVEAGGDGDRPLRDGGTKPTPDGGDEEECDILGTFGMRARIDVSWKGTSLGNLIPVLAGGRGQLEIVTLVRTSRESGELSAHIRPCSVITPDFASTTIGEKYAVRFEDALWERKSMPSFHLPLYADCVEPGCDLVSDPLNALLGLDMADPASAWPERRSDPGLLYRDHDDDGYPGLTVSALGTGDYDFPPVNLLTGARAIKLMLAIRFTTMFDGTVTSCEGFSGKGPGTRVEVRAATCIQRVQGADIDCGTMDTLTTTSEATFLDGNLPAWEVEDTRWTGVRLREAATCVDARAATYD